ncbi:YbjN domain-containing protein [Gracilimonas sp. Q87]|uniref:YbjN domain-containing protein n=1 Tax=Gracilimonas sp. Q87 TaxID=3384766 RepID=UPI003983FEAC
MKDFIESLLPDGKYDYFSQGPGQHSYYFCGDIETFTATYAITINEEDNYIFYNIIYPYDIPEDKIDRVLEYISRINYGDVFGAFIVDHVDPCVSYHASIPLGSNREENQQYFATYLNHGQSVMEEFHEGLLDVFGGKQPLEVLTKMGAAVTQIK